MSSFFTVPGKKRKRAAVPQTSKKRILTSKTKSTPAPRQNGSAKQTRLAGKGKIERDESISGSESDKYDSEDDRRGHDRLKHDAGSSSDEAETAAERRLRLAEQYLENVRQEVDETGFDAEEIDRDIIAERLQEDVAESKGKVYRHLADELDFEKATHTLFRWNTEPVTAVATCAPYAYTTSKDGYLVKWKLQDLPAYQWPQTTRKPLKKPPAPPKRRPERIATSRSDHRKAADKNYQGHTGGILVVACTADGKYVVTGGTDRRVVVHDANTLRPVRAFSHQHRDAVTGLALRRGGGGGNQLFSCSRDRTVKVWALDELAYVETLFGHQDEVVDIDALAQERCVSVGARDRTARLWKVVEETQLVFRGGGAGDASSSTSKKSKHKALHESQPQNAAGIHPNSLAHEGSMDRIAMIDDELFVTGSDNGALALWSVQKKKPLFVIPRAHDIDPPLRPDEVSAEAEPDPSVVPPPQPRWITALCTVPYSDVVLSGSWDGCVRVWRLSTDKRQLEAVGVLGAGLESTPNGADAKQLSGKNQGSDPAGQDFVGRTLIRGIVNDISMFERGDRGKDGLCVVVAIGKEHRLGRWKVVKGGRNGAMVFEVPRSTRLRANGVH